MGIQCISRFNVVCDSRGAELQDGDMLFNYDSYGRKRIGIVRNVDNALGILCPNSLSFKDTKYALHDYQQALKSYTVSVSAYCVLNSDFAETYWFKIDGTTKDKVIESVKNTIAYYNYMVKGFDYLGDYDSLKVSAWKAANGAKDARKFPVTDYVGRELKAGDMVLYELTKSALELDYGLVISETHILDRFGQKIRAHCVFKIVGKTEEEKQIYSELVRKYKETQTRVSMKQTDKQLGDVYTSGNRYYYVYLGKVSNYFDYYDKCCVNIEDTEVKYQELWMKLDASPKIAEQLKNQSVFDTLGAYLSASIKTVEYLHFHGQYYYERALKVDKISMFTSKFAKNAKMVKVGTMKFGNSNKYEHIAGGGLKLTLIFHDYV